MSFRITDECTQCGRCAPACPTRAIARGRDGQHRIESAGCIDCGACGLACPEGVIEDNLGLPWALSPMVSMRPRARVDPRRCVGCADCVSACPFDALSTVSLPAAGPWPRVAHVTESHCVGCAACELECAHSAIIVVRGGGATASRVELR